MPEVKNTFISSKMNKDLDGRILPNGQYRNGVNIQISRSEGDDVGALENVVGNDLLTDFGFTNENLEIIGHLMVDTLDTIFLFLTDYYDSSATQLDNNISGIAGECYIVSYNIRTSTAKTLVEGNFLNFSKSHPITGVNLLESLLFWTDNRNQPRKININLAEPGYYTKEDHISVAKYYPYNPILLLKETPLTKQKSMWDSSMTDKVSKYLPEHAAAVVESRNGADITLQGKYTNIMPSTPGVPANALNGDLISGQKVKGREVAIVEAVSFAGAGVTATTTVTINNIGYVDEIVQGDIVYFQRQNPDYDNTWTGDRDYLKDRFVRFSYRFKFDDGEYSLSAPFTQIAFVPEQDGYFIGNNAPRYEDNNDDKVRLVGQESETYDSTVVKFMQNKINNIVLTIPSPTKDNDNAYINWKDVREELKIIEVDILYKEAQSNKTTIVDTLTLEDFGSLNANYLEYKYQSRKPWKTLPANQTTRVSDIVPVRALAQESSGNRIMYANFLDKHSSPIDLNYSIQINEKDPLPVVSDNISRKRDPNSYIRKEYQNHTLKQNRNYQVGIVLSDRYGRQSNVILSSVIDTSIIGYSGDTFYHRYKSTEDPLLTDKYPAWSGSGGITAEEIPDTWPGDQINAIFWSIIPEIKTQDGYPGIYSVADGSAKSAIVGFTQNIPSGIPGGCELPVELVGQNGAQAFADLFVDVNGKVSIKITSSNNNWFNDQSFNVVFSVFTPGCNPATWVVQGFIKTPIDNPLGWYSYKFVVKQTQQEYYNVYLPGALAGYPCDKDGELGVNDGQEVVPANLDSAGGTVTTEESQAFPKIKFDFPKGQTNFTSHIVLFGDNINKIPKDLQDVGPLTEKFRSSERLYPRVTTFIDNPGQSNNLSPSNKQVDPEQKFDIAVQLGTMTKLGLGDLLLNPVEPTIPAAFYKGETDPLIARIETNNKFGVEEATDITACTPVFPYGPCLAVYETAPVESLLDIYWETTTSGLISDLNNSILNEDNTQPVGITSPNISWNEADPYGAYISSTFEGANSLGTGLGPACEIELEQVIRQGDGADVTLQFEIEETGGAGSGEYQLKISPFSIFNKGFVCYQDQSLNQYNFILKLIRDDGVNPVTSNLVYETGFIVNEGPIDRTNIPLDQLVQGVKNGTTVLSPELGYPDAVVTAEELSNQGDILNAVYTNCDANLPSGAIPVNGQTAYGRIISSVTKDYQVNNRTANTMKGGGCISVPGSPSFGDFNLDVKSVANPIVDTGCSASPSGTYSDICCEATVNTSFDGVFKAANGSYGSDQNPPVFPTSIYNGIELEYTIPRMYQVSMFVSNARKLGSWGKDLADWVTKGVGPGYDLTGCGSYEIVFGWNSHLQFYPLLPPYVDPCNPASDPEPLPQLPQGPIYWDFDPAGVNAAQLDPLQGGEEVVGQQNRGTQIVGGEVVNPYHYWTDLQVIANHQKLFEGPFGEAPGTYGIMWLKPGYNTFYMEGAPYKNIPAFPMDNQTNDLPYQNNAGGYGGYLGGLDINGVGPGRANNNMRFFAQTGALEFDGNSDNSLPRKGYLHCGNPDLPAAPLVGAAPWNYNIDTLDNDGIFGGSSNISMTPVVAGIPLQFPTVFGNSVPNGRYVVTLRATDRNGSGLSFEWDLPIVIKGSTPMLGSTTSMYPSLGKNC